MSSNNNVTGSGNAFTGNPNRYLHSAFSNVGQVPEQFSGQFPGQQIQFRPLQQSLSAGSNGYQQQVAFGANQQLRFQTHPSQQQYILQHQYLPNQQYPPQQQHLLHQQYPLQQQYLPQVQPTQPSHIVQTVQSIQQPAQQQIKLLAKRGRPRKRPVQPLEQYLQVSACTSNVPAYPSAPPTGPQQFYPVGTTNTPPFNQHNSYNPQPHCQIVSPLAHSNFAPTQSLPTISSAQENWDSAAAINTGCNVNEVTHSLHENYCLSSNTATRPIASGYHQYYQPNESSSLAEPVSDTESLRRIEAVVNNLSAHINNTHPNHTISSNAAVGIGSAHVAQQPGHQPHVHLRATSDHIYRHLSPSCCTTARTAGGYIVPPNIQNIEPRVQTSLPSYTAPTVNIPDVPVNCITSVATNVNAFYNKTSQSPIADPTTATFNSPAQHIFHPAQYNIHAQSNLPNIHITPNVPQTRRKRSAASATIVSNSVQCENAPAVDTLSAPRKRAKTSTQASGINASRLVNAGNSQNQSSGRATKRARITQANPCNTQPHSDIGSTSLTKHNAPASTVPTESRQQIKTATVTPIQNKHTPENNRSNILRSRLLGINVTATSNVVKETSNYNIVPEESCSSNVNINVPDIDTHSTKIDTTSHASSKANNDISKGISEDDLNDVLEILKRDAGCDFNSYEVNEPNNSANVNSNEPAPSSTTSNDTLALLVTENDTELLRYSRNASNFVPRTTINSQCTRTPPAEPNGVAINTEQFFNACSARERRSSGASAAAVQPPSLPTVANFSNALQTTVGFVSTSTHHPNSLVPGGSDYGNAGGDNNGISSQLKQTHASQEYSQQPSPVLDNIAVNFADDILEVRPANELTNTSPYNIIATNNTATGDQQHIPAPDITSDMKYETSDIKYEPQSGPPPAQPHMTSTGVEPPHSSQGPGMMVGSPTDAEGVTVMLPTWNGAPDYLDQSGIKQSTQGLSDSWDSLLIDQTLDVPQQPIAADRRPLPSFIGYTSHLSINGISGLHYHTIASSAQRSVIPSGSPTQSTNQEYYASVVPDTQEYQESPVVSSSTPCQQGSQKQQQQPHTNNQQHCNQHQHHHHNHHHQQLPQSTQQIELDIEADIARLISNAIAADTTVTSGGNSASDANSGNDGATGNGSSGGSSNLVQDQEAASRHTSPWNDIVDWFDTACTTNKHQETNVYTVYSTSSPVQTQQHGSSIPNLLTYSPLLQARLQAGNTETPSSTSTYPPVSPPGRVSTSGSPDQNLHSSYTAPSHSRKRSRGNQGTQNPAKKAAAAISYSNDANMAGGKEKPVHRCSICSRGFLNKSNIKVHLRTHTGEKPFKCTTCEKTFRQKAHLIKHQQIHKRGSRD